MTIRIAFLLIGALLVSNTYAADIYQWVDESGRTQISDVVPARYKNVATRIDTSASKVTERQRQEALKRAARERQLADRPPAKAAKPDGPVVGQTRTEGDGGSDCEKKLRAYRASQECFAPFITRFGMHGDAEKYCTAVPDPTPECGIPRE
jgi:hypothetical protein